MPDDPAAAFARDGAICLRACFAAGWAARAIAGLERQDAAPGPLSPARCAQTQPDTPEIRTRATMQQSPARRACPGWSRLWSRDTGLQLVSGPIATWT